MKTLLRNAMLTMLATRKQGIGGKDLFWALVSENENLAVSKSEFYEVLDKLIADGFVTRGENTRYYIA